MLSVRNIRPRYPKFDGLDTYTVGMSGHRMDKLFGWSGPPGGGAGGGVDGAYIYLWI